MIDKSVLHSFKNITQHLRYYTRSILIIDSAVQTSNNGHFWSRQIEDKIRCNWGCINNSIYRVLCLKNCLKNLNQTIVENSSHQWQQLRNETLTY
jgi:hypothetical protein